MFTKFKKYMVMSMVVFSLLLASIKVYGSEELRLNALSAVLYDANGGRVLYGKNENQVMPMASTTKIMTLIIALEYGKTDDLVTFSKYASIQPDVQMDAVCGEQYYLKDLLYVMMMQSYNDVAVAIAEYIADVYMGEKQDFETVVNRTTAESEEKVRSFAGLMNEKAKKLGCHSTYFITPNGLDAQDENGIHSTTAVDMAKISAYAIKIPTVEEICTTKNHTFSEVNGKRNVSIGSTNRFLDMMDGAVGMKTGYTNDAGYCYVGAVKKDDKLLISVVFGSGWPPHKNYKWADTKALMNYGINNFFYRNIFIPDKAYADIPVVDGVKKYAGTYIPFSLNLIMSGYEDVEVIYKIREKIIAPVKANEEVGIVCIYIDGKLFKTFSILTKESIDKKDFSWHFLNIFKEILF